MRKKLIEVSLPLAAINAASAREKSIRHGHPSTLHLWWARRPLAACRAVLFAQLVDDPSAWPEAFPTEAAQARERERLHGVIADMVPWEARGDERVLGRARFEIARSLARERGEAPPERGDARAVLDYLAEHAPPVCDPFCGGGSIPLEAQRLGLRARGSDLNPVAVLVSKATCEIPPKFANLPPVNPDADPHRAWRGAEGLADDVRYYGAWMRERARARIGHLYPKVAVTAAMAAARPDLAPCAGRELTVIAWLWARTVASPDPSMRGAHVPLVRSFVLSSKKGKRVWAAPEIDSSGRSWRLAIRRGKGAPPDGSVGRSGGRCLLTGAPMPFAWIRSEGKAGRMGRRLMAVVAAGKGERVYLDPTEEMEALARAAEPEWRPDGKLPDKALGFRVQQYGMSDYADLFTPRQLTALTTFSDLVAEARERVERDSPARAYADAVATYLGLVIAKAADLGNALCRWEPNAQCPRQLFARQAVPMVWDFAEANPLSASSGSWEVLCEGLARALEKNFSLPNLLPADIGPRDGAGDAYPETRIFSTDPPYYDNIGYADLSDFFYIWERRTLRGIYPDLFRRVLTPKAEELVATPYRHGGKEASERFFMEGMGKALANMHRSGAAGFPVTVYYAFKQSEAAEEGLTSPGWATFLQGVFDAGYVIDGTWPIRTENASRMVGQGANALASSIVLVCRKRAPDAGAATRREFMARLRAELPAALRHIRAGGAGPVDMAQAAIGPGMGVFTAFSRVLEPDDTPMTVRAAIALINRVRDEISGEEAAGHDPETRFCLDWFEAFGMAEGAAGDAITMAQAYDIGLGDLESAGAFAARGGTARLLSRAELSADWAPQSDSTHWECAQHLARALSAPEGGAAAAARLLAAMGAENGEAARLLAYRLYDMCERANRSDEARVWNALAQEWGAIEDAQARREEEAQAGELALE